MGGRGASSGGLTANAPQAPAPRTLQSVAQDLYNNYGVRVGLQNMQRIDPKLAMDALDSMDSMLKEFPQVVGVLKKITAHDNLGKGVMAQASPFGDIELHTRYYDTQGHLARTYRFGHPRGSTIQQIPEHEFGHIMELALIQKDVQAGVLPKWAKGGAWNACTYASKVIHEAGLNVKHSAGGKGQTIDSLVRAVSSYAKHDRSEALAECVADYRANGANAKPLSVEVWKILKRELG